MIAIICMAMRVHPAGPVVQEMRPYDQYNGRDKQPGFIMDKKQSQNQQHNADTEYSKRQPAVVMLPVAMVERVSPDTKRQQYHAGLKGGVMNDVHAEKRQG